VVDPIKKTRRGKRGAGYVNLQKKLKRQQRKVGREDEGSGSNRPELAAFVVALCDIIPVSYTGSPVLHFNTSVY